MEARAQTAALLGYGYLGATFVAEFRLPAAFKAPDRFLE